MVRKLRLLQRERGGEVQISGIARSEENYRKRGDDLMKWFLFAIVSVAIMLLGNIFCLIISPYLLETWQQSIPFALGALLGILVNNIGLEIMK